MKTLPKKPSQLLKLAVECMMHLETRPDLYQFHPDVWVHKPRFETLTKVCLAGSVLVCLRTAESRLQIKRARYAFPSKGDFSACCDIDRMRQGEIPCPAAARLIKQHYNEALGRAPWPIYLEAVKLLKAVGQ